MGRRRDFTRTESQFFAVGSCLWFCATISESRSRAQQVDTLNATRVSKPVWEAGCLGLHISSTAENPCDFRQVAYSLSVSVFLHRKMVVTILFSHSIVLCVKLANNCTVLRMVPT